MSITVNIEGDQSIQVTDQIIETTPPARVEFAVEGVIKMTTDLLGELEGTSLKPVALEMATDSPRSVEIDLSEEASLRLETVDVGVEIPDTDDLAPGIDTISSATDDSEGSDTHPGAIAFTVEGAIKDVPEDARERIADTSPRLETITFAIENSIKSDGGSGTDVLLEVSLLGYGIAVHRDGTIDISTGGDETGLGPL